MENILEHCEPTDSKTDLLTNAEATEPKSEPVDLNAKENADSKYDENDFQDSIDAADLSSKSFLDDDKNAESTDTEMDTRADDKSDHKDINMSFDEDIILPSVRHDPELEQKQRDRMKRKEMKSRKELEEEEREKMQYVLLSFFFIH